MGPVLKCQPSLLFALRSEGVCSQVKLPEPSWRTDRPKGQVTERPCRGGCDGGLTQPAVYSPVGTVHTFHSKVISQLARLLPITGVFPLWNGQRWHVELQPAIADESWQRSVTSRMLLLLTSSLSCKLFKQCWFFSTVTSFTFFSLIVLMQKMYLYHQTQRRVSSQHSLLWFVLLPASPVPTWSYRVFIIPGVWLWNGLCRSGRMCLVPVGRVHREAAGPGPPDRLIHPCILPAVDGFSETSCSLAKWTPNWECWEFQWFSGNIREVQNIWPVGHFTWNHQNVFYNFLSTWTVWS